MNQIIEHTGIVKSNQDNLIQVKIIQQSACGNCDAKGACMVIDNQEKIVEVESVDSSFLIGDKVILSCQKSNIHQAVFLAFVVPFILILITLIILKPVISNEVILGLIALSVLLPYYVILSFFKTKLKSKFKFEIRKDITE
jgi:sigma-E factor negative regulatory protein RseC